MSYVKMSQQGTGSINCKLQNRAYTQFRVGGCRGDAGMSGGGTWGVPMADSY